MRALALAALAAAAWWYWPRAAVASGSAGHGGAAGDGDASIFNPLPLPDMPNPTPAVTTPAPVNAPRGIRNNNPGNIRKSADKWQGMSAQQTDTAFVQFTAPVYGLRALAKLLLNYQAKYGLSTVRAIISRWAPPSENNTAAYINAVTAAMGQGADIAMDLYAKPELLAKLMRAIVAHENGASWRDYYADSLYAQAINLARA